ncbi:MAG: WG repeat-containing protein, partial [Bacteroidota bacterium]
MKRILFFLLTSGLSFAASAQKHLFPIKIKDKWGYTNAAGKMVIAAQYDYAESFFEDRAVVALENQPCVINTSNKRIIDTGLYINITRYSEGLAKVTDTKLKQSFIDVNGKKAFDLPANIYDARPFNNGLSSVATSVDIHKQKFGHDLVDLGYKFGYMNKKGEQVVPFEYDDADDFQNGFARFREGTKFGVLDSTGRVLVPAR